MWGVLVDPPYQGSPHARHYRMMRQRLQVVRRFPWFSCCSGALLSFRQWPKADVGSADSQSAIAADLMPLCSPW